MRLLLTRDPEQCHSLKKKLEDAGFDVAIFPLIAIAPPKEGDAILQKHLQNISDYQWLLLTSSNAVAAVSRFLRTMPPTLKIVAVGSKTAELAKQKGWCVMMPEKKEGVAGLISFFEKQNVGGQKILYPRSQIGREELATYLKNTGAVVDVVEAYQTLSTPLPQSTCYHMVKGMDAILFFSPSAVYAFASQQIETACRMIPFGATTARALVDKGYKPAFIPSEADEDIFVAELKNFFSSQE